MLGSKKNILEGGCAHALVRNLIMSRVITCDQINELKKQYASIISDKLPQKARLDLFDKRALELLWSDSQVEWNKSMAAPEGEQYLLGLVHCMQDKSLFTSFQLNVQYRKNDHQLAYRCNQRLLMLQAEYSFRMLECYCVLQTSLFEVSKKVYREFRAFDFYQKPIPPEKQTIEFNNISEALAKVEDARTKLSLSSDQLNGVYEHFIKPYIPPHENIYPHDIGLWSVEELMRTPSKVFFYKTVLLEAAQQTLERLIERKDASTFSKLFGGSVNFAEQRDIYSFLATLVSKALRRQELENRLAGGSLFSDRITGKVSSVRIADDYTNAFKDVFEAGFLAWWKGGRLSQNSMTVIASRVANSNVDTADQADAYNRNR
jgi:hypothetical protein